MNEMEVFKELVKRMPGLPEMQPKQLGQMRFVGQAAVQFMDSYIRAIDNGADLGKQREEAIADQRDLREQLNQVDARVGEMYEPLPKKVVTSAAPKKGERNRRSVVATTDGQTKEDFRKETGITEKPAQEAVLIHKNPDVVKTVMADAKEKDDVPSRTEIVTAIREKNLKKSQDNSTPIAHSKLFLTLEEQKYLKNIEKAGKLIKDIPEAISDEAFPEIKKALLSLEKTIHKIIGE